MSRSYHKMIDKNCRCSHNAKRKQSKYLKRLSQKKLRVETKNKLNSTVDLDEFDLLTTNKVYVNHYMLEKKYFYTKAQNINNETSNGEKSKKQLSTKYFLKK